MQYVVLEVRPSRDISQTRGDRSANPLVMEAWTLREENWNALTDDAAEIGCQDVDIVVHRDVLAAQSTYFRALFSDFREAGFDRVNVTWDTASFFYLLQFIYRGQINISSSKARICLRL